MTPQSPHDYNLPPARGKFRPEDRTPMEVPGAPDRPGAGQPPPKSSARVVFFIAGAVLLGGLALCAGAVFWGYQAGANEMAAQVQSQISDQPAIQEHIGEIESLELSLRKSAERGEEGRMVMTVRGSKGDGLVIGSRQAGTQQLTELVLETADGEQYPLEK